MGNTLADVGGVVRMALRGINVQIPDELVVDDKSLGFVFARPLRFVHINVVNQLVQHLFGQRPHFHELAYRMDELLPLVFLFAHFGQLPARAASESSFAAAHAHRNIPAKEHSSYPPRSCR